MENTNLEDNIKKGKLKNTARILMLSGAVPMLIWVIISYFLDQGTSFEMAALLLNGIFVIIAVLAFIRPLVSGVFGLVLSMVYIVSMFNFYLHFSSYQSDEKVAAIIISVLLLLYIAGAIIHIYVNRKSPNQSM